MLFIHRWTRASLRSVAASSLLATALITPAVAGAAPAGTGTLLGTITCGPSEETPAAHVLVGIDGTDLSARTDGAGIFRLVGVPSGQPLTINASVDGSGSVMTSRYNVVVQGGETLDIGSLDLAVCPPQPVDATPADDQLPQATWGQE
jgi:hypothetical protein